MRMLSKSVYIKKPDLLLLLYFIVVWLYFQALEAVLMTWTYMNSKILGTIDAWIQNGVQCGPDLHVTGGCHAQNVVRSLTFKKALS